MEPGARGSDRTAATAGRWIDAWTRGNLDGVRALLAGDVAIECNLGWPPERPALLDTLHQLANALDGVTVRSLTTSDARAAVLYDCRVREPAGSIRLAEFLDVASDAIVGVRRVYDLTAVDLLLPHLRR